MTTGVTPGTAGLVQAPARQAARTGNPRARAVGLKITLALLALLTLGQGLLWYGSVKSRASLDAYASGIDFTATLTGAQIIRDGDGARLYDLDVQRAAQRVLLAPYSANQAAPADSDTVLPYIHPPFEALLTAPLMGLPPGTLYLLWIGVIGLALVGSVLLLARTLPLVGESRWLMLAAICAYAPMHQVLLLGQSSPLVLLGLCGAYAGLKRGRDGWAGVALALMVVKPQMLLVVGVVLLLQLRWRPLVVCGSIIAGLTIAAMPILGLLWPLRYAQFLAGIGSWSGNHNEYPSIMHNWRGLIFHFAGGASSSVAGFLIAGLTAASLGALLWVWWRGAAARSGVADLLWALACVIAILAAPHLYIHDLTLLIFPAWIVVWWLQAHGWPRPLTQVWLAIIWGGFAFMQIFPFRSEAFLWLPTVPDTLLIVAATALLTWQALRRPAEARPNTRPGTSLPV